MEIMGVNVKVKAGGFDTAQLSEIVSNCALFGEMEEFVVTDIELSHKYAHVWGSKEGRSIGQRLAISEVL